LVTTYLEANIPQGWAAGSVFAFVQMILGLRADAPRGRLLSPMQ
jgi:glycogen debranching enzyme